MANIPVCVCVFVLLYAHIHTCVGAHRFMCVTGSLHLSTTYAGDEQECGSPILKKTSSLLFMHSSLLPPLLKLWQLLQRTHSQIRAKT